MNITLWILQVFLALHTAIGAIWKLSNSAEQTMPSFSSIPHEAWMALSVIELICALALILPALYKPFGVLAPIAALVIAVEMFLFSGLHIYSGNTTYYPIAYWGAVAALCTFIAYGRFILKPI